MSADAHDLLTAVRRLAVAQTRTAMVASRRRQLNPTSWAILSELSLEGELTNGQIAARLGMSTGGVTPALDRLERAGLAVRRPNPADRRSSIITVTEEGAALLSQLHADVAEQLEPTLGSLAAADRKVALGVIDAAASAYASVHAGLA